MDDSKKDKIKQTVLPTFISSAIATVFATVFATIASPIIIYYFIANIESADPKANLSSIGITSYYNSRFNENLTVQIPSTNEIFQKLENHPFATSIRTNKPSIKKINQVLSHNEKYLSGLINDSEKFLGDYDQLIDFLETEPITKRVAINFFDIWKKNDNFIYPMIRGKYRREILKFKIEDLVSKKEYLILLDDLKEINGKKYTEYSVNRKRGLYRSTLTIRKKRDEIPNEYVAKALTHFDKKALEKLLGAVHNSALEHSKEKELLDGIKQQVKAFSRFAIDVTLTNLGKTPITISVQAKLYINTIKDVKIKKYTVLDIESRTIKGKLEPIILGPEESRIVKFFSDKIISDNKNWERLVELFEGKYVNSFVQISLETDGNSGKQYIVTNSLRFGETQEMKELEEDEVKEFFDR